MKAAILRLFGIGQNMNPSSAKKTTRLYQILQQESDNQKELIRNQLRFLEEELKVIERANNG